MPRITALTLIAALAAGLATAGAAEPLKAWIEPVKNGNMTEFRGFVSAPNPTTLRFKLAITRVGAGGSSTSSQGGATPVTEPNQPTLLSRTSINIEPGDRYEAVLSVWSEDGAEIRSELRQGF